MNPAECLVLSRDEGMTSCHPTVFPMKASSTLFLDQVSDRFDYILMLNKEVHISKLWSLPQYHFCGRTTESL